MTGHKSYAELSEEERHALEDGLLRRHRVNLERVQRIHQDIDTEPMEFSADSIAKMLDEIADQSDCNVAFTLQAVSRALRGQDDHHVLILKQKKRGKFVSPTEHDNHHCRIMSWLHTLAMHEQDGVKTEAAVALIAENWGVSRASVFAGIKEAEDYLESGRTLDWPSGEQTSAFTNPRPNKSDKT
ncbi:hypothetical protein [Novosphingobium sp. PP1Y]|uniref:hypothetical protein n=1 Tax=Novosphingobium sp. PP1Y TaxID=702113 RepID=UPI00020EF024|nr:hypothetical protein [Novosphingobium sp. PP1Y]CCA93378.1 hypothetical protein PP1Y_AT25931 [Novosphingobium sp. PP1Y]